MRNPGWIDLQVNGCSGIDFSSPELTGDDFLRAAEIYALALVQLDEVAGEARA